jgi:hypothetical protein
MNTPRAAYTWDDSQTRKVTVTAVTALAAHLAGKITGCAPRQDFHRMTRSQFRRFQHEFAGLCEHPATRLYVWTVEDTIYLGCSDCGRVLVEKNLKAGRQ